MNLEPGLYGGSPVTHVPADPVADGAFSVMTPPIQRVDGHTQHLRKLGQAEQPLHLTVRLDHDPPPPPDVDLDSDRGDRAKHWQPPQLPTAGASDRAPKAGGSCKASTTGMNP